MAVAVVVPRLAAICLLAATLTLAAAGAGELRDPTRPWPSVPAAPGADAGGGAAAAAAAPRAPVRVQMIVRHGETRTAMVDGQMVHRGDELVADGRKARVTRITDHEVVLAFPASADGPASHQTLELVPGAKVIRKSSKIGSSPP